MVGSSDLSAPTPNGPLRWNAGAFGEVFTDLFGGQLGLIALRTVVYVAIASVLCVLIGYPVAYFVARRVQKRKALWLAALLAPFWINYLMRMLAWVNLLSPDGLVNRVWEGLGLAPQDWLAGQHLTVILGLVYGYIPFFILPLYAALDRIDRQVIEAARDLGASPTGAFWRVTLPYLGRGCGGVVISCSRCWRLLHATPQAPRGRMIGNQIDQFVNQTRARRAGSGMTLVDLPWWLADLYS